MNSLIIIGAKYPIFAIIFIALAATALSEKTIRNRLVKLALLAIPIAFLIAFTGGQLFYNTRPFVVEHTEPLIAHVADNGFPSDHTLLAMVGAAVVFVYRRKLGVFLGILAVIVGVSRVFAKVHYPIDIVGSIVMAIAATCIAWTILRKFSKQ